MTHRVVSEYTASESTHIKVYVRARPPDVNKEASEEEFLTLGGSSGEDMNTLTIKDPEQKASRKYGEVAFTFDKIMWSKVLQDEVFAEVCKPQVEHVLNGYNCCCFACKFLVCTLCLCHFFLVDCPAFNVLVRT